MIKNKIKRVKMKKQLMIKQTIQIKNLTILIAKIYRIPQYNYKENQKRKINKLKIISFKCLIQKNITIKIQITKPLHRIQIKQILIIALLIIIKLYNHNKIMIFNGINIKNNKLLIT
ncbi:hypothetical protein IMG5_048530 [Ichthyophthirius multifiliis]|uniref:Uncharacterized protein n=1 Tax=Ichthyophthirius multifiliis TaxID=5932 RepID=G0QMH3_ICHMU|nr:hypothetical protein IMG5_048530 [Ichthyophthirius multifiliis]EGR33583.1 hypothetical protein IMG5_048530 [Ichthyophthirius multifiliis]|eukprot:XP_004037569.1 hypothetical protein IMG5_048530 [Ichthyophthirius multifiliis]